MGSGLLKAAAIAVTLAVIPAASSEGYTWIVFRISFPSSIICIVASPVYGLRFAILGSPLVAEKIKISYEVLLGGGG
jgi:hypothetical protein